MTTAQPIDSADPHPRRSIEVLDAEMSFVDAGYGDPIVFLHGNPTSSYLWRNIIPHLKGLGRCLAPDLVGMGRSSPSRRNGYRFLDHAQYLDVWFDILGLHRKVILVVHEWGSALGFHRAFRYPEQIEAIAYMEAFVRPLGWKDLGEAAGILRALRSERGERLVLKRNVCVETMLSHGVIRRLTDEEMTIYRARYLDSEDRMPTLVWPRQMPIEGQPADVHSAVQRYASWLPDSVFPKLLISSPRGLLLNGRMLQFCRTWDNQREVQVSGRHFLQEDSPHEVGRALAEFIGRVRLARPERAMV